MKLMNTFGDQNKQLTNVSGGGTFSYRDAWTDFLVVSLVFWTVCVWYRMTDGNNTVAPCDYRGVMHWGHKSKALLKVPAEFNGLAK
jgi:hypothetical protein